MEMYLQININDCKVHSASQALVWHFENSTMTLKKSSFYGWGSPT